MRIATDDLGIIGERRAMREFLHRFVRRAPKLSEHVSTRIVVNLKTGERSVERLAEKVAVEALADDEIAERIAKRAHQILEDAIEGAARKSAAVQMRDIVRRVSLTGPTVETVIKVVSEVTGLADGHLVGPRRARAIFQPRFLLCSLLRDLRPDLSLTDIGKALRKDHTTIMHAVKRFDAMRGEEPYAGWLAHPAVVALYASAKSAPQE